MKSISDRGHDLIGAVKPDSGGACLNRNTHSNQQELLTIYTLTSRYACTSVKIEKLRAKYRRKAATCRNFGGCTCSSEAQKRLRRFDSLVNLFGF